MFYHCFSEKIRLDVLSESSARQRIHIKNQALFSSKDKSKKLKCRLQRFLFGALRVKLSWPRKASLTLLFLDIQVIQDTVIVLKFAEYWEF